MKTEEITIKVDPDTAKAYRNASAQMREKLDLILNLNLHDATKSQDSLKHIMAELSNRAKGRGLTPVILEMMLNDENRNPMCF